MKRTILQVHIPEDEIDGIKRLKKIAQNEDRTLSWMIRMLIKKFISGDKNETLVH